MFCSNVCVLFMLVLPAICRQLTNNQYLKNCAYLSLRMYCKPRFQSWFVKMFAKANLAVFRLSTDKFIFGCRQFPSRWGSCPQRGQRGTGLWCFLHEVCALQILLADWLTLTCLCVWLVQKPKLGWTLECLEKSFCQLSMLSGIPLYGEVWLLILFFLGGVFWCVLVTGIL